MDNDELRALMDEEARAAEVAADEPDDGAPLPAHVTVSRANRARGQSEHP